MKDSRIIANHLLGLAEENNRYLTILQLLKLVYLVDGRFYGTVGRPLIIDHIEAWTDYSQ